LTSLFYSLDEAARELNISETVLVRLSQTLRVPESAYEETGYLSFRGDLSFTDHDISFFRQVKQRLLAGETLEDVKRRINPSPEALAHTINEPASFAQTLAQTPEPPPTLQRPMATVPTHPLPLQEVVQSTPEDVETLANKNFERYKHQARPGSFKVFQNMLAEVTKSRQKPAIEPVSAKPLKPRADENQPEKRILPRIEPMRSRLHATQTQALPQAPTPEPLPKSPPIDDFYPSGDAEEETRYSEEAYADYDPTPRIPKFEGLFGGGKNKPARKAPKARREEREERYTSRPEAPAPAPPTPSAPHPVGSPWENLIRESNKDPRELSLHLKTAAQVLREKALKQGKTPATGQRVTFS